MKSGDFLPHRSDTEAGRARCDVVNECMKPSDCGTSHQPPYRSAERSPGQKSEGRRAFTFRHSADSLVLYLKHAAVVRTSGWMQRFFLEERAKARKLLVSPVCLQ